MVFKGFLKAKVNVEEIKKRNIDSGMSEAEAIARAEMEIYSKGQFKIPKSNIQGEIPEQSIIVKIKFDNMEDATLFSNYFKIDKASMSIEGREVMEFFRKCNLKSLGG